jgi:hypothetical protein
MIGAMPMTHTPTDTPPHHARQSLNRLALSATAHCLTGCAIGEVLGVVIGTALGWTTFATIVIIIVIPGAMDAGLDALLFWGSLAFALALAFVAAYPVNRYLIARGRGHAVVHRYHGH